MAFDPASHSAILLKSVHPDLAKVANAAAQTPQPWVVVYGIRTEQAEQQAVASGHSTTMHSRHLPDKNYTSPDFPDGLACAFDVAALINGQISWAPGNEAQVFGAIVNQIKAAAAALAIPIDCGADWATFRDWGHVQLRWSAYP